MAAKGGRNKTIDTPLSEGRIYLDRCISVAEKQSDLSRILDKTIIGNMLEVCPLLPEKSMDLIIADPPYNLTKSYSGTLFTKKKDADYEDWSETENGNYRDTCPSNFWDDITIPFWSMAENTAHPTQKPEKLIAKIMLASSSGGNVVFDPFLGSGTTSVVAKKLNRRYIGIEVEKQYCVWAEQRLEMAESNPEIQGYADGVFWERNSLPEQKVCKRKGV